MRTSTVISQAPLDRPSRLRTAALASSLLTCALMLAMPPAQATIVYRCSSNGATLYADHPCAGQPAQRIDVQPNIVREIDQSRDAALRRELDLRINAKIAADQAERDTARAAAKREEEERAYAANDGDGYFYGDGESYYPAYAYGYGYDGGYGAGFGYGSSYGSHGFDRTFDRRERFHDQRSHFGSRRHAHSRGFSRALPVVPGRPAPSRPRWSGPSRGGPR